MAPAQGQVKVAPEHRYERVLAVVPLTGAGTYDDPRRPMFAPSPVERGAAALRGEIGDKRNEILGFRFEVSDDGQYAIVEFTALDRAAFRRLFEARRADVVVFEKGRHRKEDVEAAVRRFKRDFSGERFTR